MKNKSKVMKDLQGHIKEKAKAYSDSVIEDEFNPLRKYTVDDLMEEMECAFEQGANFMLSKWRDSERWRKVEEELPEETGFYLCECCNSVGYFYEVVLFTGYWRGSIVRKWKPIK